MDAEIQAVALVFLDTGSIPEDWEIDKSKISTHSTYHKTVGALNVFNIKTNKEYLVIYESLTPLHGIGVDDIHIITSITPLT